MGERIKAVQENFTLLIELFDQLLLSTFGREEVGKRDIVLLKEKALIDAVFENGDYGIYNHNLQNIYYRCARDQAYIKNKEKVSITGYVIFGQRVFENTVNLMIVELGMLLN